MSYVRFFNSEDDADDRCANRNRACRRANNYKDVYAVVDGPEDNFAVVDLKTAISLGCGYRIVD